MNNEKQIIAHYTTTNLLNKIVQGLATQGKSPDDVESVDLVTLDEFHVLGLDGTIQLTNFLDIDANSRVLDIGSGLGGPARYVAKYHKAGVVGIDLLEEYVSVAKEINKWLNLDDRIKFIHGNANNLPFETSSFDSAFSIHVGMNVENKHRHYSEIARVLKTGGKFGIFDFMAGNQDDVRFPLPWADDETTNFLIGKDDLVTLLQNIGFTITEIVDVSELSVNWIDIMLKRIQKLGKPPPIGLHLIFGSNFLERVINVRKNIMRNSLKAYQLIVQKN